MCGFKQQWCCTQLLMFAEGCNQQQCEKNTKQKTQTMVGFARLSRIHSWIIPKVGRQSRIHWSLLRKHIQYGMGVQQMAHADGIRPLVPGILVLLRGYSTFMMVLSVAFTFLGRGPRGLEVYWAVFSTIGIFWDILRYAKFHTTEKWPCDSDPMRTMENHD